MKLSIFKHSSGLERLCRVQLLDFTMNYGTHSINCIVKFFDVDASIHWNSNRGNIVDACTIPCEECKHRFLCYTNK